MAIIRVLPVTVQNKIAAGEVIERPASVVKELVENAIDAGAITVSVEMEDGGHRLVRVSDDGCGMDEEDLVACMQRHATSKIRDVDDIFRIASFGFRGEALPSIGSVSRMTISSCPIDVDEGHELVVEAGRLVRVTPAAPRKGTQVEVRDIFFNTPARRKFLRTPASEHTRATEMLTRLALGNPGVGFRLQTNERLALSVRPAASQLDRIRDLFGDKAASRLTPFAREITDGLRVDGFFLRPPESRRNSKDIYILVNKRWIRHYGLARAIGDVFQGILPPRVYPLAVVNVHVDPAKVDVNAHPTKEEVRFEQDGILIAGVKHAFRDALEQMAMMPTAISLSPTAPAGGDGAESQPRPTMPLQGRSEPERQSSLNLPSSVGRTKPESGWSNFDFAAARERLRGAGQTPRETPTATPQGRTVSTNGHADTPEPAAPGAEESDQSGGVRLGPAGQHRLLGQASGKYLLVDGPDGILLVDPHALHERQNYDRLVEERGKGGAPRRLLLPLELELSPAEAAAAAEAMPGLAEYGFELEMPETNRLVVTAAPSFITPAKLETVLRHCLADLAGADETLANARDKLLASLACHSSVLLGRTLPEEEVVALLDRFFNQGQLPTCPHGRPTAIRITWEELAQRFGR
ncbi:MAG: DNA mismatch repair endonuclease MutL [Planctomycetaceae bacterium]|nr:DNA mismatch repair endonuclease MutL [Planctomycetaceae bacterium]